MKNFLFALITLLACNAFSQTTIQMTPAISGQTISTCNGFIIDSGGQGGAGYGNNQTVVVTICPDTPGDVITLVFNTFQLNTTDDNPSPNVTNVDYMDVYDGNSTSAPTLGTYSGTQLQGVVIMCTPLNTSGCLTIRFRSNSTGTGMFTASATCTTPCATPTAGGFIVAGETPDSTRICIGDQVDFSGVGSFAAPGFTLANYAWDFMDGTTATGQNVSHSFSAPGQYRVQLIVTDNNGCTNTNLLDLQVFVATLPTFAGFPGDTTLCMGESVVLTAQPVLYPVTWTGFPGSATVDDGCLTDDQLGVAQEIPITQTGFSAGATLTQVSDLQSLCLDMEHSFMGDLVIIVECPNGQSQVLHQQGGGGTQIGIPNQLDNVDCSDPSTQGTPFNYCFTPTATETWVDWANNNGFGTLPAGDYEPIQPFSNLLGCPLNGVWTLIVVDNWAADDGTLFSFELNMAPYLYEPVTTFEPQIGLGSDSSYWVLPAIYGTRSTDGDVLTINPGAPGTYTYNYIVLDNFGCQNDSSVTVTVNENPQADAGADATICNGTPIQLDGNIVGGNTSCDYTFNLEDSWGDGWNGNNLHVTINGVTSNYTIPAGLTATYTLSIPNGAAFTVQFDGAGSFINECSYEVLDASGNVVLSDGTNGNASTTVHNLTGNCLGNLTFEWTPAGAVSNPAILTPTATVNTNTTLTLTVYPTGHPLCATTDQVNVNISASAYPGANNTLTICAQGAPTDLFPLLGPGASPNGTWKNAAGAAVAMPYDPITMNPGVYTYSVDSNGCVSSATITVTEINPTVTAVPTAANCHGIANGSATLTATNATEYSLDGGANTPIPAPFVVNGLAAGNHQVIVYNVGGCTDTVDFVITEPVALSITSITPDLVTCSGDASALNVTGTGGSTAYTFTWFTNAGIQGVGQNINVNTITTTQYCVVMTEACGSQPDSACMTITVPQPLNLVLTPDDADGCYPHHVIFSNNTPGPGAPLLNTIDFGDGSPVITTEALDTCSHTYEHPGVYTVSIMTLSDSGCTYMNTFTNMITVYDIPVADFNISPNPTTIFETHILLNNLSSTDVVSYSWSIPGGEPNQSSLEDVGVDLPEGVVANYAITLVVTSEHGCIDSVTKIAQVLSDVILYAPNTFTPDGDEFNQTWFLYMDGIDIQQFNLKVFNRWGEVVWESNDPAGSWDGTYQGTIVPNGQYTWILETKELVSDKKYTFNGYINVLR